MDDIGKELFDKFVRKQSFGLADKEIQLKGVFEEAAELQHAVTYPVLKYKACT